MLRHNRTYLHTKHLTLMEIPDAGDHGSPQFDEWAVVELFGHQKMAGHVSPAPISDMLRIDVYADEETVMFTRFVNPKAIYAINPCSKEIAIGIGRKFAQPPVSRWEVRHLLPQATTTDGVNVMDRESIDDSRDKDDDYDIRF